MRTVKCVAFKLVCACAWCVWLALASCEGLAPSGEVGRVDSLNGEAYAWRYRDLDSSRVAARRAFEEARFYRSGKAEACNNLAFCAFMEMDFKKAEALYRSVYELTKNELELLVADVGLMRLYQRTALNKEFYDYRNSAPEAHEPHCRGRCPLCRGAGTQAARLCPFGVLHRVGRLLLLSATTARGVGKHPPGVRRRDGRHCPMALCPLRPRSGFARGGKGSRRAEVARLR